MRALTQEEIRDAKEHQDVLADLREILKTKSGRGFIRYLYKNLDVGALPQKGVDGAPLFEHLGFLRAGQSVFKIVSQADFVVSGQMLAQLESERYEQAVREAREDRDGDEAEE